MPKTKISPQITGQLRLFQQGSGAPRALPLPPPRPAAPAAHSDPPDLARARTAAQRLVTMARR